MHLHPIPAPFFFDLMESQILISVSFSHEFGIMQKSLTIIIIKKLIMNFWNFLPFPNLLWLVYGHEYHPLAPTPHKSCNSVMCRVKP